MSQVSTLWGHDRRKEALNWIEWQPRILKWIKNDIALNLVHATIDLLHNKMTRVVSSKKNLQLLKWHGLKPGACYAYMADTNLMRVVSSKIFMQLLYMKDDMVWNLAHAMADTNLQKLDESCVLQNIHATLIHEGWHGQRDLAHTSVELSRACEIEFCCAAFPPDLK